MSCEPTTCATIDVAHFENIISDLTGGSSSTRHCSNHSFCFFVFFFRFTPNFSSGFDESVLFCYHNPSFSSNRGAPQVKWASWCIRCIPTVPCVLPLSPDHALWGMIFSQLTGTMVRGVTPFSCLRVSHSGGWLCNTSLKIFNGHIGLTQRDV